MIKESIIVLDFSVMSYMLGTRHELKIFDSIIGSIMVHVMNMFSFFKRSSQMIGHYVSMFLRIGLMPSMLCHWMTRNINQSIPPIVVNATFPLRRSGTPIEYFSAFYRAIRNPWISFSKSIFAKSAHCDWRFLEASPNGTVLIDSSKWLINSIFCDFPVLRDIYDFHSNYCMSDRKRMSIC